ncbi:kinetochore-associated protein 1-like [Gigantopelta aegis]|uniref:kinetochore-associated protein 1-like n=1 Tax=Gigantopelta aegis TaxID=1735272 RepID=UPI001B88C20D|nr:kinetochore-associated protein 1-like [Gigantopelta aegis]
MAPLWELIETDFGGDETTVFGPRKETGTALYQVETLASILPTEQSEVTSLPHVVSAVLGSFACVAVDKLLAVFSDSTFTDTFMFDSTVDALEWSPDGKFLVVGCSDGFLYILDSIKLEILISKCIVTENNKVNGHAFKRIMFHSRKDDLHDLICLAANGQLIVMRNLDLKVSSDEIGDLAKCIFNQIKIILVDTSPYHTLSTTDVIVIDDNIVTLGSGDMIIVVWSFCGDGLDLEDSVGGILNNDAGIISGKVTPDNRLFFLLDENHCITLWSSDTLTAVQQWSDLAVSSFQILDSNDNSASDTTNKDNLRVVLVTENNRDHFTLQVLSFPSSTVVYNLQLNSSSVITQCLPIQEVVYLVEYFCDQSCSQTVSAVRFKFLLETEPETRLYRLIRKKKFQEAEEFARLFNLDIELVYKAKLNIILDQLSPWNASELESKEIDQLISEMWDSIELITDDLHLADTCLRAALPTYSDTYRLQDWCRTLLEKVAKKKQEPEICDKYQDLMTQFCSLQNRFCTYRMAYGSDNYSAGEWDLFMRANLMKEACRALRDERLDVAFTLWRRHQEEWTKHMKVNVIENILASIPDHITTSNIYGWLKDDLIPYVSRVVPLALTHVLNWAINRALNMERFEKEEWPQNALRFLKSVDGSICEETKISLTDSTHTHCDSVAKSTVNITAAVTKLHDTLTCLQNLHDLKYKYKHCLSLKQFQQETMESVVFRMLDRVKAVDLLAQTLKNQVRPYIAEHKLNENEIFSRYAADHLNRKARSCTGGTSHWEAKLIAVIGYIQDPKEKISAIIDIVMLTPLPLNSGIENLIQSGLEIQHPLVNKLKEHIRKLDVRILISKYSLRNKFVPSKQHAMHLIYFILSKDTSTCIADALKVMQTYDLKCRAQIHAFHARFLISHNRVQEYLDMLKSLSPQILVECGKRMIYSQPEVHQPAQENDQEALELKKRFIYAAVETGRVLDNVVQDILEREELRNDCKDLQHVLSLQNEYNIMITLAEYRDQKSRELLLFTYVKKTFSKPQREIHFGKLYRLADLLQISRVRFLSELAIFTARTGHIASAVKYSRKIIECGVCERTVSALYDVGMCFLQVLGNVENIEPEEICNLDDMVNAIYELACEGTVYSQGVDLLRCMELYKCASLAVAVTRQCENGHGNMGQMELFGKFFTLEPMFKEDALVMRTEDVVPIAGNYLVLHPSFTLDIIEEEEDDEDRFQLAEFCRLSQTVIGYLMNNSHMELAFQFLTHTVSSAVAFVSQHFMGFTGFPQMEKRLKSMKEHLATLVEEAKPSEEKLISELFFKSLNSSKVDHKHALLCISSLPLKVAKKILLTMISSCTAQHNYKKLKTVAVVGIALGEIHRDPDMVASCRVLQPQARWGYRLRTLKIDFSYALRSGNALKILAQIAPHEMVDIKIVKQFCQDFNLEEDDGLMVYLEKVVGHGCKHIKVRAAIREIKDQDSLLSKLNKLLKDCSPYDYDKIHFLLGEIQQLTDTPMVQKGINILEYIKVYTRRSSPSAYEKKYFEDESKKETDLSMSFSCPTNETKLPYHLLVYGDPWEIISPELHYDSLQVWISLASELEIKEDNIYTGAARNMICEYVKAQQVSQTGKKSHCNWNLSSSSLDFLNDIQELLLKVSSVPVALACTQFAIKELPTGAEKIQALKEGTALAKKWYLLCEENSSEKEKAQKAFMKFSSILNQLSTQRVLHLHDMAEPELLILDRSPKELIMKLFEQPAIVEQGWRSEMCDAYEIAEEIAEINDLNLQDFISSFVDKWLPSREAMDDGDNTITFDLSKLNKSEPPSFDDDDNLKRVLYIMKKGSLETNVIYLLNIAFPQKTESVKSCNLSQLRALHCLLQLCDNDLLMKVCDKTADSLRDLTSIMGYLVELEKLHFVYNVEKFQQCDKESLVKGLWRNHSHKKNAVLLVASLCLDYDIHNPVFWEQLLKQFLTLGLLDYLETLLIRLCSVPDIWTVPSFGKAWQAFLYNALNKYCPPLSEPQEEMCVHYFNILHRCPVIMSVDVRSLADQYQRLELAVCAACCLILHGDQAVKEYLDGNKLHHLQHLDSLMKMGLNAAIAQEVQGAIFDMIDEQKEYLLILGSTYKHRFIQHVIKCDKINHLVEFAVKHKRLKEAANLVKSYCSFYTWFGEKLSQYMETKRCNSHLEAFLQLKDQCCH